MNLINDQAVAELRDVIEDQQLIFITLLKIILNNNDRISKQIKDINSLEIKLYKDFYDVIRDYLYTVSLFSLKQVSKELKMKNPKKLSSNIKSWINATSDTVTNKYLAETDQNVTLPVIDNIDKGFSDKDLLYRANLVFNNIKEKKPEQILLSLEGKAIFRGRDLAVQVFNRDIKLEMEGFLMATISDILVEEKVVAAQWSAILDQHVCELCASLDGKIISIDDPDYAFYVPGEMHLRDRCLWVYIRSTERPENRRIDWKTPNPVLVKKFGKPDIKQHRDIDLIDEDEEE